MSMSKICPNPGCGRKCSGDAHQCLVCHNKALQADRQARDAARRQEAEARRQGAEAARQAREADTAARVVEDRELVNLRSQNSTLRGRYSEALSTIERLEHERSTLNILSQGVEVVKIAPMTGSGTSEGTVVAVVSDWHIEERVDPRKVNGLNEYSLEIAHTRAEKLFRSMVRLVRLLQQDIQINNLVLALLGDFISNQIHEELAENNETTPTHAIVEAQNLIIAGIEYVLEHTALQITVPCHSGNHGRVTRTSRFGDENGHSLEYLMYLHLAAYFRNEPRVQFMIAAGPHSFMDVYSTKIRFHHGHMIRYQGGVGGIYIPVNKAIAQWNKANPADLDVFGHYHQHRDGGNFVCNGSLIGYNAFALSIKADFEPPKQALFLLDKKRGRTCTWPILFTK